MIGGIVTSTVVLPDKVFVDCEEEQSTSKCAVYCARNEQSEAIKPGDNFWWQSGFCMWTPHNSPRLKCGEDYDIRIPKIGFSGVKKP